VYVRKEGVREGIKEKKKDGEMKQLNKRRMRILKVSEEREIEKM
jgi:hypothetical protein